MSDNNTWPGKPGVPMNPDMREKLEYALAMHFSSNRMPHMSGDPRNRLSSLQRRNMEDAVTSILEVIGPCLTPAEVDEHVATAHKEWLAELNHDTDALMENARDSAHEEAALRLEELHKNHRYNPETGDGSEHDVGYYRALAEGAAWIRALDPASKGAADLVAQARREALTECIAACDAVVRLYRVEFPEKWKDKPGGISFEWKQAWENNAGIAKDIAADIRALSDTPPNMVLVPREPTNAMIHAGGYALQEHATLTMDAARIAWGAMVKAVGKEEGDD